MEIFYFLNVRILEVLTEVFYQPPRQLIHQTYSKPILLELSRQILLSSPKTLPIPYLPPPPYDPKISTSEAILEEVIETFLISNYTIYKIWLFGLRI